MRFLLVVFLLVSGLRAEIPAPLEEALNKISKDFDCWAFTETTSSKDDKGRARGETVVRFDPSKPYAEQFTPLVVNGKPPTPKDLTRYRKRGEKRGERLMREEKDDKKPNAANARFRLGGSSASIDIEHAVPMTGAPAGSLLYRIPLRNDGRNTLPVDKFQLVVRINEEKHVLENASLKLLGAFRVKLIAKVKDGEASADFSTVDPKFNPVLTKISGDATATIMFVTVGGTFESTHADFQRVKPYSERFGVKIGPLKALDF